MEQLKLNRVHGVVCKNVLEELRKDILLRNYPPGTRLLENKLASDYRASRGSIRVAVQTLIREGIISDSDRGNKIVLEITKQTIENMYELREWLEIKALETILSESSIQYTPIMGILSKIEERSPDRTLEDYYKLDIDFHKSIIEMSKNRAILQAWNNLASVIYTLLSVNASSEYKERYIMEFEKKHKDIMSQIILRDKNCITLMKQHIEDAKILTLGVIEDIDKGTYRN